jgi:hypothetical protein
MVTAYPSKREKDSASKDWNLYSDSTFTLHAARIAGPIHTMRIATAQETSSATKAVHTFNSFAEIIIWMYVSVR